MPYVITCKTFNPKADVEQFDQQGFNSTQAMDAFDKTFGEYSEKAKGYVLPTYYLSLLNSLVYLGFAAGKTNAFLHFSLPTPF